jgi:hypothetical protein
MNKYKEIRPQEGFQRKFLSSPADIVIGGGAAGAGKTHALLMESLRYVSNPDFGGAVFRKTYPQIMAPGGLWDNSMKLYPIAQGRPYESSYEWKFKIGSRIKFSHLEYEKNVLDWQGSQVPFIGFDELTHFSEYSFLYLLSRNRSTCGIRPYVRATCNPDPDSWVAEFISWWIDQDEKSPTYGFPIAERAGKLRYFVKDADEYVWGNSKKEVLDKIPHLTENLLQADPDINVNDLVKSVTFIPGNIYENKELLRSDPGYLGNLMAQDEATQQQLLHGNWKVVMDGTDLINLIKLKDTFSNEFVQRGEKYITADIALKGSDLLVVMVWDGFRLIDVEVMEVARGNDVIDLLKDVAKKYGIPQSHILYDDDGAGSFVDGFIRNARQFNNGRPALRKENYKNLKSQMYFKMADRINQDGYYISPDVLRKMIGGKTIEKHLVDERRAIKRDKPDIDGKLCIIPKDQMKNIIGHSPDFMDAWMMRECFEYFNITTSSQSKASLGFF